MSPFEYGKAVKGKQFINRKEEVAELISNFQNYINTILISPRRWGKTSLVEHCADLYKIKEPGAKICFLDLFNIRDENDFYNVYIKKVIKSASSKFDEWVENTKNFLSHLVPKVSIGPDPLSEFNINIDLKDQQRGFEDILNLPEKISIKQNQKLIICIDEFQNLLLFNDPLLFQKRLRSAWQHHHNVCYILYGSKRHLMSELFTDSSMPFYKFGNIMFLPKIHEDYFISFISNSFKDTNKKISSDHIKKILAFTKCNPFYTQQLAHIIWINTTERTNNEIIDYSIEKIINQNEIIFKKEVEELPNTQINFLNALINNEEKFTSTNVLKKYKLGTSTNVSRIKSALEKKQIIDTFANEIIFEDPLFEYWFKERYIKLR